MNGYGLTNEYVDPLYSIDPPSTFGLSSTFGNNIEVSQGWVQVPNRMTFADGEILKGQWSRQGTWLLPWDVRLFGQSQRSNPWHTRKLETTSQGTLYVEGPKGLDLIPLRVRLEYENQIDGYAVEDGAMVMNNWAANWGKRTVGAALAPDVTTLGDFAKKVVKDTLKDCILDALDTGIRWFPEESRFTATTQAVLTLKQDGVYFGLQPPPIFEGVSFALLGGLGYETAWYYGKLRQYRSQALTVNFSPGQPLTITLALNTEARILGGAQAYAGIRGYRLQFDLPNVDCQPLILTHTDPIPEAPDDGVFYKGALLATVNTPELVAGSVETTDGIGPFSASIGDKLVSLGGKAASGFVMPLRMPANATGLRVRATSVVAEPDLASEVGIQIVLIHEDKLYSLFEHRLDELFTFSAISELPLTPYGSEFMDFNADVRGLPRGDSILVVAFGPVAGSVRESMFLIDAIWPVSDRAPGDLSPDGRISLLDLASFAASWLRNDCCYPNWCGGPDLDHSGVVDLRDYATFASAWKEIHTVGIPPVEPAAHWALDEGVGAVTNDSVGANHGDVHGAAWTDGVLGGALRFDGFDDYVDCGSAEALAPETMTLAFWMVAGTPSSDQYVVGKAPRSGGSARDYTVCYKGTGQVEFYFGDLYQDSVRVTTASPIANGAWVHMVAVRDGTQALIYVDGVLAAGRPYSFTPVNRLQPLTLGALSPALSMAYFKGMIDDVRLYDWALSAGEIQSLYMAELP